MSIKDRLIQFVLRGKDELSPAAKKSAAALDALRHEAESLGQALDQAKNAQGLVGGLKNTQRAVENSKASLEQTEQRIEALREALNKTPDAAGLQQSLKDAEREAGRTRRQVLGLTDQLGAAEKAAQAAGIDTRNLAGEETRLAAEADRAKSALANNSQQLKALQREQAAAARAAAEHTSRLDAARESMSRGAKQVVAFAAAYVSLNAAMGALRTAYGWVRDGIAGVIAEGSNGEQALAQLEATLNSTGHAAGLTSAELLALADTLRDNSLFNTEQIVAAEARLLSYTDVAKAEFPRAMQVVIDQAQRLGVSVEQSAELVGRALQSPDKAMEALGRQGFKLEAGQKRLLTQLVATGKTAEAQGLIMDMLAESYGGAAAAARMETFVGLWKGIKDQISDFSATVAASGAFDYIKQKLVDVGAELKAMASDGRLDRLAQSLSDAFVRGAEAAAGYAKKLKDIDFEGLAERAANAVTKIGPAIEQSVQSGRYATATLTTVWNAFAGTVNAAAAALMLAVQQTVGRLALAVGQIADLFGGSEIRAKADGLYDFLGDLSLRYAEQAKTDYGQVAGAWDFLTEHVTDKAKEQTATVKQEADDQFRHIVQRVTDINNALAQIDAAEGVAQLKQLQTELFEAYRRGALSQQDFAASSALVNQRLRDLGGSAPGTAAAVRVVAAELKSLADVQSALASAQTAAELAEIRKAITALYQNGTLTAAQYNDALKKTNERQKELKAATEQGTKAQQDRTKADKEALVTSEQLRRESGKRMEEERRAGDAAMQARRKGANDAKRDMAEMEGFFGGVMSRAREPLAAMSDAALEAFDALRGISTVDMSLDTSGLEATTASLQTATRALGEMQKAAATVGMSGLGRWMADTALQSQQLQVQYLQQKQALQSMLDGYESGRIKIDQFTRQAQAARHGMNLLNDSDLRTLEGAIDAAKQKMEQLQQGSRSALVSLQEELMNLRGETEALERSRFASRKADMQQQMAEAQKAGDLTALANLQRAMATLREIETETGQKRQREEQQKRIDAAKPAEAPQPARPSKIIRLETARGKTVEVGVNTDRDETNLLSILEDAGLRAL